MNWIALASAVGVGTLLAKFVDIFFLQPKLVKRDRAEWLREKRFEAFVKLTKNLVSFGSNIPNDLSAMFDSYAVSAEALLLIDDRQVCEKIDFFIAKRADFAKEFEKNGTTPQVQKLYEGVYKDSRIIIRMLREEIRNDEI